jgi:hypothetical protein
VADGGGADLLGCAALDLAACVRTPGCAAEMCPACPCGAEAFQACAPIATAQRPSACPALACTCCRNDGDCGQSRRCVVTPDDPACALPCGPSCTNCGIDVCSGAAVMVCTACVTDADCPYYDACSGGACSPRICVSDADCPADQTCDSLQECVAKGCASDADCFSNCIDGSCGLGAISCQ